MKLFKNIGYTVALAALFGSCSTDADKIMMQGFDKATLTSGQTEVVVSMDNKDALALSLAWNEAQLTSNNSSYGIANSQRTDVLQADVQNTFASPKETTEKVASKSYTGSEINDLALKLGLSTGQVGTIYFRIKSTIGANMETLYSNTIAVKVTPFQFDNPYRGMIFLPSQASQYKDFSTRLYSAKDNGKYEGFVYANQWDNFLIYTTNDAATATVYGSAPNSLYSLDASANRWNIWYDEGGYFFVEANLNDLTWKKTAVTSISVVGDFNSWSTTANQMTYDPATKLWTVTCNISNIGWGIKFLVNQSWDWAYTDANKDGTLVKASDPNITPISTGTYKITVDLSNPAKFTYKLEIQ